MDFPALLVRTVHFAAWAAASAMALACLAIAAAQLVCLFRRMGLAWWTPRRAVFAALAALAALYAGSKHVSATWDEAFRDCRADVSTNDWRTVTFEWKVAPGVPSSATAEFYYADAGEFAGAATNDVDAALTLAGSTPMGSLTWTYVAESPAMMSNMLWYVKCSYSQGPTVVTNGVYRLSCAGTNGLALKWVPMGVRVYDGRTLKWRRLSPPEGLAEPAAAAETSETADGGTPEGGAE